MARLTKTERRELLEDWLDAWRQAGSPRRNQQDDRHAERHLSPFNVEFIESVQQLYGVGSRLRIRLGCRDVTPLVARLSGYRLCKGDTVIVRSGVGSTDYDRHLLGHLAYNIHIEAAVAFRDFGAVMAGSEKRAGELEPLWLGQSLAEGQASVSAASL